MRINKILALATLSSALLLTGCAAKVNKPSPAAGAAAEKKIEVPAAARSKIYLLIKPAAAELAKSEDWGDFRNEWREAMQAAAKNHGKEFFFLDNDPSAFAETGTLLVVTIKDYRYISTGKRYGLGVMTGNAYVNADVKFYELPARRAAGSREYATSSSAWEGVFSAMTTKQLEAISEEIVKEISK